MSAKKIKNKFDASGLAGKYEVQGASLKRTIKAGAAEKTEIIIGSTISDSFEPSFEFKKWDEVRLKLTPVMGAVAEADKDFDVAGDKIKYKTPKEEVHFYEAPQSENLPEGGYEIEWILNEKPTSNVLIFDIETDNLEFFYQPIYTDAEIAEKADNGDFVNPDAMGSYAIYHKNVPLSYDGGKLYGTGKVGQLYRPKINDSTGNWTYGDLNIDVAAKKLTVAIPQSFVDNAVYPIYRASGLVFGYQTIGTAGSTSIENSIDCSQFTMGTNAGAVTSITVYSNPANTARTFGTAIYLHSDLSLVTNSGSAAQTPSATGAAWRTVNYGTAPSVSGGTDYLLCIWGTNGTSTHVVQYDTGSTNQGHVTSTTGAFSWPNPLGTPTHSTNKYSIYATYTPVPDAPTSVSATDGTYTDKVTVTWTQSSGATGYHVWRDTTDLGLLGDVATYDDTGAAAPTITPGSALSSDGTSTAQVELSVSGASANNGTTYTYKVTACNTAGCSVDSNTDTGYIGVGALTYQWQRSAADSDASYSNISGATTASYNDTGAPADGSGRYFKVVEDATGAAQQTSASDRGYRQAGSITTDIVNGSYVSVGSPTMAMSSATFSLICQTITGSFGTASEQIYVNNNNGANNGWTLTLAAQATTNVWDSAGTDYDFNDPTGSGCTDGGDADSVGGQMTVNPSVATLAVGQCGACTTNNVSKGASTAFNEGTTDTITLLTATAASDDVGDWTLQGVSISQKIPAEQPAASDYDINMVLTVAAS